MSYIAKESYILKKQYIINRYNKEKKVIGEDVKLVEKSVLSQMDLNDDTKDILAKQMAMDMVLSDYMEEFRIDSFDYCKKILKDKYEADVDLVKNRIEWNLKNKSMDMSSAREYINMIKKDYLVMEESTVEKGKISKSIGIYDRQRQIPVMHTVSTGDMIFGGFKMQPTPLIMFRDVDGQSSISFTDFMMVDNEKNAILMDTLVEKLFHISPPENIEEIKESHRNLVNKIKNWRVKPEELLF